MSDLGISVATNMMRMQSAEMAAEAQAKIMRKALDTVEGTAEAVIDMLPDVENADLGNNIDIQG